MRTLRRATRIAVAAVVAAVVIAAIVIAVPGLRDAVALYAVKVVLGTHGLSFRSGDLHVTSSSIDLSRVEIDDASGGPFFTAIDVRASIDPHVWFFGRTDRAYGLHSLELDAPRVRLVREADGSYNIAAGSSGPSTGRPPPPLRATIAIRNGTFEFHDPSSPSTVGRAFDVRDIDGAGAFDQGVRSTFTLTGAYVARAERAAVTVDLVENDAGQFAEADIRVGPADVAPIIDGVVPTPAFVLQRARVSGLALRAFSIGYDPATGPEWRLSGNATLADGDFRVVPLTEPVVSVHGMLAFAGGELSSPELVGTLEHAPLTIRGGLRLIGGVRLGLSVQGRQSLHDLKKAFAFSHALDVDGPIDIAVRVDGLPSQIDVAAHYTAADEVTYSNLPFSGVDGTLFYNGGHITIPSVTAGYDGGSAWAAGDVDLTATPVSASFDVLAAMPSDRLPIAANVSPGGIARAFANVRGPAAALEGSGFADVRGGLGDTIRTALEAGPKRFAVGPAIIDDRTGGEAIAAAGIDRTTMPRTIGGAVVAHALSVHALAAARVLPGVNDAFPISLPATDGTIDGTAIVSGAEAAPAVAISGSARDLVIGGVRLGHAAIAATGSGGRIHISTATLDGSDATLRASGDAMVSPRNGRYAAALHGVGSTSLAAFGGGAAYGGMRGRASGAFDAALSNGHWTVAMHADSGDARAGPLAVRTFDATLGGGGGAPTDVYVGQATLVGGTISGIGAIPGASRASAGLNVWTDGVDVSAVAPTADVKGGRAIASARIGGTLAAPTLSGAALVVGSTFRGQPLSGDLVVQYQGGALRAHDGRVTIGDSTADVDGSISGLSPTQLPGSARLSIEAAMREGDLAALTSRYLPPSVRLAGTASATLHIGGTLSSPRATGYVNAGSGTLQGVAFHDLRGSIDASSAAVQVAGASIGFGSSNFDFAGSLSTHAAHVRAASPQVDLSDFNDFFAGYDTLEGRGYGQVAIESTAAGFIASGGAKLTGTTISGFPLGTIDAAVAGSRNQLTLRLRQSGDAGSSDLHGNVTFASRRGALPDFRSAHYDLAGSITGVDIGRVAPLVGREDLGVSGRLDATGYIRGGVRAPTGHAQIAVHDGHVGKVAIQAASGTVDTDGRVTTLRNVVLALPFAHVEGEGTIGPGKRIAASAGIEASDLGQIAALGGRPGTASGTALAAVAVSGTLAAPKVATKIESGRGTALGVRFDQLSGSVNYQPGEVDIANAEVDLAGSRGVITVGGTLPLQLSPFGLGPKGKAVSLTLAAKAVDLRALDPLTSRYASMTGMLDVNGTINGTAGRPKVGGSATLRDASFTSPLETVPAEHVNAQLALAGDTLTLTRLRADVGRGTLAGSGAVHIIPAVGLLNVAGLQYWTRLHLNNAQIDVPNWTAGSVSGDLRLTKSGTIPYLAGDITLDDGTVPFAAIYRLASGYGSGPAPEAGPVPGVPELRPGHIVVYGGPVYGEGGPYVLGELAGAGAAPAPTLPLADLGINARAGRDVRVHGGPLDLTAGGGVQIGGNTRALTLAGEFTATRGQIGYFDTNFRLVRGVVTFDPTEGLLPTLDVKAITNLSGDEITLTVTGRIDNLQTDLSSNPSMSRDEIIATLLHAPQVQSVISSTPGQAQTALYAEAQSYFNAQLSRSLLFPVESLLAQTINVEQISLIYDQQNKLDVEVRKLITPTVYAIYRSSLNIPVTQTAGVAYSLRDYADLEILQTSSSSGLQQSVLNLRLTFH